MQLHANNKPNPDVVDKKDSVIFSQMTKHTERTLIKAKSIPIWLTRKKSTQKFNESTK